MSKAAKIHAIIPKLIKEIGAIEKNGRNDTDGYEFRLIDEICSRINPLFSKHNISCAPEMLDSREEVVDIEDPESRGRKTKGRRVVVKVKYKLTASDGSFVESVVPGEAIDESDKAFKKAMTAAFKTMITQVFCLSVGVRGLDTAATSPKLNFVSGKPPSPRPNSRPESSRRSGKPTGSRMQDMKVPDGRFKGRMLSQIPRRELIDYFEEVESAMAQSGKKPPKWFLEVRRASGI